MVLKLFVLKCLSDLKSNFLPPQYFDKRKLIFTLFRELELFRELTF